MLPRWMGWVLGVVVLLCTGGIILAVALGHGGGSGDTTPTPAPDASVLTAYTAALAPPTKEGGRIVEQEMKPSLGDFESGKLDAAGFVERAKGWQLELARVRDQIDRISVPPAIASAGPLFHTAMQAYIDAARLFEHAGEVSQAQRQAALDTAVAAARRADSDFDVAAQVVQRALRAAGLPADHSLPDVTPTPLPT